MQQASSSSAFSTTQSKFRSLKKVEKALPNSPRKSKEIVKQIVKKLSLRIQMSSTGGKKSAKRRRTGLSSKFFKEE